MGLQNPKHVLNKTVTNKKINVSTTEKSYQSLQNLQTET